MWQSPYSRVWINPFRIQLMDTGGLHYSNWLIPIRSSHICFCFADSLLGDPPDVRRGATLNKSKVARKLTHERTKQWLIFIWLFVSRDLNKAYANTTRFKRFTKSGLPLDKGWKCVTQGNATNESSLMHTFPQTFKFWSRYQKSFESFPWSNPLIFFDWSLLGDSITCFVYSQNSKNVKTKVRIY